MNTFTAHLTRQAAFSRATFGPGPRTEGVCEHIGKELAEIAEATTESGRASEWVDVAILGFDGLLRSIWAMHPQWDAEMVAEEAVDMVVAKQGKNERRLWPDWRTAAPGKAIEHKRGTED